MKHTNLIVNFNKKTCELTITGEKGVEMPYFCPGKSPWTKYKNKTKSIIINGLKSISIAAFENFDKVEVVTSTIVEKIENSAFSCCQNLKRINIPKIKYIGSYAFFNDKNLKSIYYYNTVYIGHMAFYKCIQIAQTKIKYSTLVEKDAYAESGISISEYGKPQKFIIDFEYNGLPRYNFMPEITQAKITNIATKETFVENFSTANPGYDREFYADKYGKNKKNLPYFSKYELLKLFRKAQANLNNDYFYGFSIETDRELLHQAGIQFPHYFDIQERLMLSKKYEKRMAYGGRSLEFCYFMVTGTKIAPSHDGAEEMSAILALYKAAYRGKPMSHLTIYPWGDKGGTPLNDYCKNNYRQAAGYIKHHNDALSASLTYYFELLDKEGGEEI